MTRQRGGNAGHCRPEPQPPETDCDGGEHDGGDMKAADRTGHGADAPARLVLRCVMRRRHLNRNFTKPEAIGPIVFFRVRLSEW
jgi:hypothetical protein